MPHRRASELYGAPSLIDWDADPQGLRGGDLSTLAPAVAAAVRHAAQAQAVIDLAHQLGLTAIVVVIALLAKAASRSSRSAERLARAVLGSTSGRLIKAAMSEIGL